MSETRMMRFFRKTFCIHDYVFVRKSKWNEKEYMKGKPYGFVCSKCGKVKYSKDFV